MTLMMVRTDSQIIDLQNEFHSQFPFLKIEFFKIQKPEYVQKKAEQINPSFTFASFKKFEEPIPFDFDEDLKISDVKSNVRKLLGVECQIFRKSGSQWIETRLTEDWTLHQQNEEGRTLSES